MTGLGIGITILIVIWVVVGILVIRAIRRVFDNIIDPIVEPTDYESYGPDDEACYVAYRHEEYDKISEAESLHHDLTNNE